MLQRYKHYYLAVVLLMVLDIPASAQSQAMQQLRLDIEKLAQLKAMLNNMYNGYSILTNGYDNIRSQAQAGFNLHKNFIDQLSAISPAVKNSPLISTILSLSTKLREEYRTICNSIRQSGVFTDKELNELTSAYEQIIAQTARNLDALQQVTTAGKLQMSEADRLFILESLVSDMEKQLTTLRNFTTQAKRTVLIRQQLKKDNQQLRSLYGIGK